VTIAIRPCCGTRRGGYEGDLGKIGMKLFFAMGVDSPGHTKSSPSGVAFTLERELLTDVRFGAHSGLKSDIMDF
jgi:hypothetical protein